LSIQTSSELADVGTSAPAVRITDLHKKFGALEVLKGISLDAPNGGVVAIIGGSGSGKSTMLRCINMLETPTSGRIELHGEELLLKSDGKGGMIAKDAKQLRRIRSRLAMVFQSFNLWQHLTVMGNIIEVPMQVLGMSKDEAVAKAEKLLARVGLAEKRDVYPAFLSGGQQQRAAIARALAVDPKVMLFDEPTSALDPELVGEVLAVIADLAREGRTMLLVTHEMRFARDVASHVVFLANGKIEEEGAPDKLYGSPQSEKLKKFLAKVQ
jgi:octopine/nopaline transport system ATP-binding protein